MKRLLRFVAFVTCSALFFSQQTFADQMLQIVADINDNAPGAGNFSTLSDPAVESGEIIFRGSYSGGSGLFRFNNGSLNTIVESTTNIPGTSTAFGAFTSVSLSHSNGHTAFLGPSVASRGVYSASNGTIKTHVRSGDTVPGHPTRAFSNFSGAVNQGGTVAFTGSNWMAKGMSLHSLRQQGQGNRSLQVLCPRLQSLNHLHWFCSVV